MTPYQSLYGRTPPSVLSYTPGTTKVHSVDIALRNRDDLLKLLRSNMAMAQNKMKQQTDQHRTERTFEEGDWVYLKLHPYRQKSLVKRPSHKLAPRFYGPFQIVSKIGTVTYKLRLPPRSKLHPIFHVSLLKKKLGANIPVQVTLPPTDDTGSLQGPRHGSGKEEKSLYDTMAGVVGGPS
ncbi:PREDICTED: uncharacterized protein LOC101296542 [Fragaria vesca subsp. vesca]